MTRRDEEHTLRKVFRTDIQGKRKRGRPKIRWKDSIQRDLENFWTESERGDGQGGERKNKGNDEEEEPIARTLPDQRTDD